VLVIHAAAAVSRGGANLVRKERDEIFRVLGECVAEMAATRRPLELSAVQEDDDNTSTMHAYA